MRGVVMHSPGDVRVEERQEPRIVEPSDALIGACCRDDTPAVGVADEDGRAAHPPERPFHGGDVVFGQFRIPLDWSRRPSARPERVVVGIRPEAFEDTAFASPGLPALDVDVVVLEELGSDAHVFFRVDATRIATPTEGDEEDERPELVGDPGSLLNARVDPRTRAEVGEPLRLAVDPARFHFFDAGSGASLLLSGGAPVEQPVGPLAT